MDGPSSSNGEWGFSHPTAVILGARLRPDGTPSAALVRRVAFGCGLYHQGVVKRVLMTGGATAPPHTEAGQMARHAQNLGVPEASLIIESQAMTTRDNARLSCALLIEPTSERPKTVIVITDLYHLPRAWLTFTVIGRRSGLRLRFRPCLPPADALRRPAYWRAALREIPAFAADLLRCWLVPPPSQRG